MSMELPSPVRTAGTGLGDLIGHGPATNSPDGAIVAVAFPFALAGVLVCAGDTSTLRLIGAGGLVVAAAVLAFAWRVGRRVLPALYFFEGGFVRHLPAWRATPEEIDAFRWADVVPFDRVRVGYVGGQQSSRMETRVLTLRTRSGDVVVEVLPALGDRVADLIAKHAEPVFAERLRAGPVSFGRRINLGSDAIIVDGQRLTWSEVKAVRTDGRVVRIDRRKGGALKVPRAEISHRRTLTELASRLITENPGGPR
ncbi:hypothetical protein [Micromonospora musae]|uniref:hypothetical protein n=1 Tax=Micromonospora musae TaxID=1894970 RepID=UPI0033D18C33